MNMVYYKARDGMNIPAYVTLPKAARPSRCRPWC
jgi:hypothetical protein